MIRVAEKRRHFIFNAGRANDLRIADFDQHRSFGVFDVAPRNFYRAQLIFLSAITSHVSVLSLIESMTLRFKQEQFRERFAAIHMTGQRFDFRAFNKNLHIRDFFKIQQNRID